MAKYKIQTGDSMSKIAAANNTTVDELLKLNSGNPSVKSANLILSGGEMVLPDPVGEKPSPTTSTAPGAGQDAGAATATPPTIFSEAGFSASFMGDLQKQIETVTKDAASMYPKPPTAGSQEEKDSPEYKALQATKDNIKSNFASGRDEIQDILTEGEFNRKRSRELLGMTPAAIRYHIDDFLVKSDKFDGTVARAIERLTQEENAAIANADASYAAQIRQQKKEYVDFQRQALSDKLTFMTNAFSMLLTGKQYERQVKVDAQQEASNRLNTILQGAQGKSYDKLSPEIKSQLEKDSETMGLPIATIRQIIETPQAAFHVASKGAIYVFDKQGNVIRTVALPGGGDGSGAEGLAGNTYLKGYLNGDVAGVSQVPTDYKDGFLSGLEAIRGDAVGSLMLNERASLGAAQKTPGGPKEIRDGIVDRVTKSLSQSPSVLGKILGVNQTIGRLGPEQEEQVKQVVRKYSEELIPDEYILKAQVKAKNPFLGMELPEMPEVDITE